MSNDDVVRSLREALAARPDDVPLRLLLARLLMDQGLSSEATAEIAQVLQSDPENSEALALVHSVSEPRSAPDPQTGTEQSSAAADACKAASSPKNPAEFDWKSAENQVGDLAPPMFVEGEGETTVDAYDAERPDISLADVGGLEEVKKRLEVAFLAPAKHPELRRQFGKSLRGGLLLYGPPGCGKTFIARALAGELGAHFVAVRLDEVLDMWVGQSERNLHEVFEVARRHVPCVLFFDEVDAIGQKRSQLRASALRAVVNHLLYELDDVSRSNEGLFVLAATNMPWDVDPALQRPGRFDRTLLVLPPDEPAREAILRHHLRDRPVANVDLRKLARATEGYSGADLAHVCETAAERALMDSAQSGTVRFIDMTDLEAALAEVRSSIGPWLEAARNVAMFANEGGQYDGLLRYLKKRKLA